MNINDNYINDMLFENENNDYEDYERIGEPAKTLKPVTVNKDFPKEKTVEIMNKYNKGKELVSLYEDILKEILNIDVITEKDTFRKDIPEDRKEEFLCAAKEYRAGVRMISEAKTDLIAKDVNFIPFDKLEGELTVEAKVRYSGRPAEAIISQLEDGRVKVSFKDKQRAITKGQSVVFYQGNIVVGGGIIEKIL